MKDILADLLDANHILADQGVVDGFGHVSARIPERPDRFLLARSMAPALVSEEDIMIFDLDGEAMDGDQRRPYLERFIHAAIYRRRPDVHSVVHSHSPSVVPFSVAKQTPLKPICHMSGFLAPFVPNFEIREAGSEATDMLIRDPVLGQALAATLGESAVVLMRGHGSTVVGNSIRQAVFRAVYTEANARLQLQAAQLGEITFLNDAEAANAAATNDGVSDRSWEMWRRKLALSPAISGARP